MAYVSIEIVTYRGRASRHALHRCRTMPNPQGDTTCSCNNPAALTDIAAISSDYCEANGSCDFCVIAAGEDIRGGAGEGGEDKN
jgi:hypothetical protein